MKTVKEENQELESRKRRVRNIKRGIIIIIASVILIPIIMCICLLFKVNSMQKQIDELYEIRENARQEEQLALQEQQEQQKESEEAEVVLASQLPKTAEPETPKEETEEKKKVYLTFDDGPSENTDEILDVLKEYDVKATFFVVGKEDEHSKEMYRRIVNEGHSLGMHSYSHQYSVIYQSVESFAQDIEKLKQMLKSVTGEDVRILRFPGGSSNKVSSLGMQEFIKYLNEQNITYFDWNVSSGDATSESIEVDTLVENVMKDVKRYNNSVVLMHDAANKHNTVEALPKMIEQLKALDVEILPITDDVEPIQHVKAEEVEER